MLTAVTAAYCAIALVIISILEFVGAVPSPSARTASWLLGGYAAVLVFWLVAARFVDPWLDGTLNRWAGTAGSSMQFAAFRSIEMSIVLLSVSLAALSLLLRYIDPLLLTCCLLCVVACAHGLLQREEPLPAPPLPSPETVPLPQPDSPGVTEPTVVTRLFRWDFMSDPVWGEREPQQTEALIDLAEHSESSARERIIGTADAVRQWGREYVRGGIGPTVAYLGEQLRALSEQRHLTRLQEAVLALSFAQSAIEYMLDSDSHGQVEYPKYGVETIYDANGDCEDKAILASAILEYLGHDTVLFNMPGHVALGLATPTNLPGAWGVNFGGRTYYFCETTAAGAWVGELPAGVPDALEVIPV